MATHTHDDLMRVDTQYREMINSVAADNEEKGDGRCATLGVSVWRDLSVFTPKCVVTWVVIGATIKRGYLCGTVWLW